MGKCYEKENIKWFNRMTRSRKKGGRVVDDDRSLRVRGRCEGRVTVGSR